MCVVEDASVAIRPVEGEQWRRAAFLLGLTGSSLTHRWSTSAARIESWSADGWILLMKAREGK